MANRKVRSQLTVQAKDTYDPVDYITVHIKFFDGMREAIRRAHGPDCACIYCGVEKASMESSPVPDPMSCPHCDGITPRGVLEHAPGCPALNR